VIRLLDKIKLTIFPILVVGKFYQQSQVKQHPTHASLDSRQRKVKTLHMNVKEGIGEIKRNEDTVIFGVVPIGGAIVHPR
jgi:hypothetical protein